MNAIAVAPKPQTVVPTVPVQTAAHHGTVEVLDWGEVNTTNQVCADMFVLFRNRTDAPVKSVAVTWQNYYFIGDREIDPPNTTTTVAVDIGEFGGTQTVEFNVCPQLTGGQPGGGSDYVRAKLVSLSFKW